MDNSKITIILLVTYLLILPLLGCCKQTIAEKLQNNALSLTTPPPKHFKQLPENLIRPAAYFVCGEINNTCPHATKVLKIQSDTRNKKVNLTNRHYKGDKHEAIVSKK